MKMTGVLGIEQYSATQGSVSIGVNDPPWEGFLASRRSISIQESLHARPQLLRSHCTALDRASDLASALTCTRLCNDF